MSESKRIEYIDLAKGICIILVVFMHIVPELGQENPLLINLRMPFYYFLSGMFFKAYGGQNNFIIKKVDRLLIPFIGWYLLSYGIYYVRVLFLGHPEHVFRITDLFFAPDFYNGSLWFLLSLFWCNIIYLFIEKYSKNQIIAFALILFMAALGGILSYYEQPNYLYFPVSLVAMPFFYFGRQSLKVGLIGNKKVIKDDITIILICIMISYVTLILPKENTMFKFYLNRLESGNLLFMYIGGFSLILSILTLCKYIGKIPFISFLGRYSIIVLVTHRVIGNLITRGVEVSTGIDMSTTRNHLILFGIIMVLMLSVIPLCRKFLPYICAQKSLLTELKEKNELKTYLE